MKQASGWCGWHPRDHNGATKVHSPEVDAVKTNIEGPLH